MGVAEPPARWKEKSGRVASFFRAGGKPTPVFTAMVEKMFNGAATAKGALIITPEKVIVTTPGAENKKVL